MAMQAQPLTGPAVARLARGPQEAAGEAAQGARKRVESPPAGDGSSERSTSDGGSEASDADPEEEASDASASDPEEDREGEEELTVEEEDREGKEELTVKDLAGRLAGALAALAEDRAHDGRRWGRSPVGVRWSAGRAVLFHPRLAARNAELLAGVAAAAGNPGREGLAAALVRAQRGLTRGGECRAALEKACREGRAAALASLRAAQRRRSEALEESRMQQGRGRAALGCSRPVDAGPEMAALRLQMLFGGGRASDAVAAMQQASDAARCQVLALHARVRALAQFLDALDQR